MSSFYEGEDHFVGHIFKNLSNAEILSFSAKKRKKAPSKENENSDPNRTRKFDIGVCTKGSTEVLPHINNYMMSPDILQPKRKQKVQHQESSTTSASSSAQALALLASPVRASKDAATTASATLTNQTAKTATSTVTAQMQIQTTTTEGNTYQEYGGNDGCDNSGMIDGDSSFATQSSAGERSSTHNTRSPRRLSTNSNTTNQTENTENTSFMTVGEIKETLLQHLVSVLNEGTYDELLELKGIGRRRATNIMTERNAGYVLDTVWELEDMIGMNRKTIDKFIRANFVEVIMTADDDDSVL